MRIKPIKDPKLKINTFQKKRPLRQIELNNFEYIKKKDSEKDKQGNKRRTTYSIDLGTKQNLKQIFDENNDVYIGASTSFKATSTPHTSCINIEVDQNENTNLKVKDLHNTKPKNNKNMNKEYLEQVKSVELDNKNQNNQGTILIKYKGRKGKQKRQRDETFDLRELLDSSYNSNNNHTVESVDIISPPKKITPITESNLDIHQKLVNLKIDDLQWIEDDIPLLNFELPFSSGFITNKENEVKQRTQPLSKLKVGKKKKVGTISQNKEENCSQKLNIRKKVAFNDEDTKNKEIKNINTNENITPDLTSNSKVISNKKGLKKAVNDNKSTSKVENKTDDLKLQKRNQINFVREILISEPRSNRRRNTKYYTETKAVEKDNSISRESLKEILINGSFEKDSDEIPFSKMKKAPNTKAPNANKTKQKRINKTRKNKRKNNAQIKTKKNTTKILSGKELLRLCSIGKDPIDLLEDTSKLYFKVLYYS